MDIDGFKNDLIKNLSVKDKKKLEKYNKKSLHTQVISCNVDDNRTYKILDFFKHQGDKKGLKCDLFFDSSRNKVIFLLLNSHHIFDIKLNLEIVKQREG